MRSLIIISFFIVILSLPFCFFSQAQVVLEANGPGSTYELINSVLAPGNTAVEAPDQCGNHGSFGRHIAEVWDATLNKFVFEFYSHVAEDNDRCISFDRQRVEIKSYDPSPANLKATLGETVTYKWFFRLPNGFQPSNNFTHIHQIKAVGGDDDDPLFTITPRLQGNGNTRMEIIYVSETSASNVYLATAPLSQFLGEWVEVTEQIFYGTGTSGRFSIVIKRVSDGATLINYSNNALQTFRAGNTFVRPKWGIYRSLNNAQQLRDDSLRLASILIFEGLPPTAPTNLSITQSTTNSITLQWMDNASNETNFVLETSANGTSGWSQVASLSANSSSYLHNGLSTNTNYYYRVKAINPAGESIYSNVVLATTQSVVPLGIKYFEALVKQNGVQLSWQLFSLINQQQIELQHSINTVDFNTIIEFNNLTKLSYSFLHSINSLSKNYYRLKIINKDASVYYSNIITIINNDFKSLIYPNPARDFITISLNSCVFANESITIYDFLGKTVLIQKINSNSFLIDVSPLPKGMYLINHSKESSTKAIGFFTKL